MDGVDGAQLRHGGEKQGPLACFPCEGLAQVAIAKLGQSGDSTSHARVQDARAPCELHTLASSVEPDAAPRARTVLPDRTQKRAAFQRGQRHAGQGRKDATTTSAATKTSCESPGVGGGGGERGRRQAATKGPPRGMWPRSPAIPASSSVPEGSRKAVGWTSRRFRFW